MYWNHTILLTNHGPLTSNIRKSSYKETCTETLDIIIVFKYEPIYILEVQKRKRHNYDNEAQKLTGSCFIQFYKSCFIYLIIVNQCNIETQHINYDMIVRCKYV